MRKIVVSLVAVLIAIIAFTTGESKASTYDLKYIFNGDTFDTGSDWLTANFTDSGPNTVTLRLTSNITNPGYYIQEVAFNIAPTIKPCSLLFTVSSASGTTLSQADILHGADNAQFMNGSGNKGAGFDILLNFPRPNKNRFNDYDSITLTITGSGINASSFNFPNTSGTAIVGAHIALGDSQSSAITNVNPHPVPIPGTAWLLFSGLLLLPLIQRILGFTVAKRTTPG